MTTREQRKQMWADMFGQLAPNYERVGPPYFSHFGQHLIELAQLKPGMRVLDVATGPGTVALPAAEQVGGQGHVLGIDLAQGMIDVATQRRSARGLDNLEFRVMDAENLGLPDASFDAILCSFGIMLFDEPRPCKEFFRVLKPGGTIALSTWGRDDERWAWIGEIGGRFMPAGIRPPPPPPDQTPPLTTRTVEGMTAKLSQAGFTDVQVIDEVYEIFFANLGEWASGCIPAQMLLQFAPSAREAFMSAAVPYLEAIKTPAGFPQRLNALFTVGRRPA